MTALLDAARSYLEEGEQPIPIPFRSKRPGLNDWPNLRLTVDDLPKHFNGKPQNIGILNGAPSGNLIDIDLDSDEAVAAAPYLLPHTRRRSGRERRPNSHNWYCTDEPPAKADTPYDDPLRDSSEAGHRLGETRSTGSQTVVWPSVSPDGDAYLWHERGKPAFVPYADLHAAVGRTMAAALLARHWPGQGVRHDAALALSGVFLRGGMDAEAAADVIETAARVAGDDEVGDRRKNVATTARRLAADEHATGYPAAARYFDRRVLKRVAEWLELRTGWTTEDQPLAAPRSDPRSSSPAPEEWAERQPLPSAPAVPTLPSEMLPEPLRACYCDLAARTRLPLECFAAPGLVAVSAVVGRAIGIRPWAYDDFTVIPNLWGGVVASAGALKTYAINKATMPLKQLANAERDRFTEEALRAQAAAERIKAEADGIRAEMRADSKEGGAHLDDLEGRLADKLAEFSGTKATERRYWTSDATVEKLGDLLRENPRGLLVSRDELAGWLAGFDRPGHEGDREFALEAWNGDGSFTVDRIGRGTTYIPALCLSVVGGVQPGKLRAYVRETTEGGIGADGLIARLQMLVYPDRLPAWEQPSRWPDSSAQRRVFELFLWLDRVDPFAIGAVADDHRHAVPYLRFDIEAQRLADRWRGELEDRLRSGSLERTPAFEAHLSKYRSLFPTLALLLHLIGIGTGATVGPVGLKATRLAAAWCEFLEAHAAKVYAEELAPGYAAARLLAQRLEAGAIVDGSPVRDIYRAGWTGLATPEQVFAGLDLLCSAQWVRLERLENGGRPSQIVRLHPDLRGAGNA